MKTDELIGLLARGAGPAPSGIVRARLGRALAVGGLLGLVAALVAKDAVPMALMAEPGMWLKFGYAACMAAAGVWWLSRLARPAAHQALPARGVAAVFLAMAVAGAWALMAAPEGARMATWMGSSWRTCPFSVAALSLPALAGSFWALRGLAPTRPRLAGFAAGVFAGAVGAFVYAVTCDELSPAFVFVWYSLGIALPGVLGALLGPRLLRW